MERKYSQGEKLSEAQRIGRKSWRRIPIEFIGKGIWRRKLDGKTKNIPVIVEKNLGYGNDDPRDHVRACIIRQGVDPERIIIPAHEIYYKPRAKR